MSAPQTPSPSAWKRLPWRRNSLSVIIGSLGHSPSKGSPSSPGPPPSTSPRRLNFPPVSLPAPLDEYCEQFTSHDESLLGHPEPIPTTPSIPQIETRMITESQRAMSTSLLHPAPAGGGRAKQVRGAKEMQDAVEERAKRMGSDLPQYDFLELIGKGAYGRVFKCRRKDTKAVVAVKVVDVDSSDLKLDSKEQDEAIKDFSNEISILHQLRDSKAKNINTIHDAFNFHTQLWIVSDYCPGGSLHTLMKASNGLQTSGLEEPYIVAVARELAVALKHVHDIGIIHRDVKAANILVTEDGQLQLCDFGVSAVLESNVAKRSTIIGTPYWMSPEIHESADMPQSMRTGYGTEIDIWAFGCTMYELATGLPPNARIAQDYLSRFLKTAPKLEGDAYSEALRQFIAFCLREKPEDRPTADDILRHPFVANTQKKYPTSMLRELIERYAMWERTGGVRQSLFAAHGAEGPGQLDDADEDDEWNFSTTDQFNTMMFENLRVANGDDGTDVDSTPKQKHLASGNSALLSARAARASLKMGRLFDASEQAKSYNSSDTDSDLPLRTFGDNNNNVRESVIDLDAALDMDEAQIDIGDVPTIRAKQTARFMYDDDDDEDEDTEDQYWNDSQTITGKRKTRDWKFPMTMPAPAPIETARPRTQDWTFPKLAAPTSDPEAGLSVESREEADSVSPLLSAPTGGNLAPAFRPKLRHMVTEPLGNFNDNLHFAEASTNVGGSPDRSSMIDLDAADVPSISHSPSRQSTSGSFTERTTPFSSFHTNFSGQTDPFEYAPDPDLNSSTGKTSYSSYGLAPQQRQSMHMHSQSEPNRGSDNLTSQRFPPTHPSHLRGSSLENDRPNVPAFKATSVAGDEYHDVENEANLADTEENTEGYNSGIEYPPGHLRASSRHQQHGIWDDFGMSTIKHNPQRSISYKDRLKPGSEHWRRTRRQQSRDLQQQPPQRQGSVSSVVSGSLRVSRRNNNANNPNSMLTRQNVQAQTESEWAIHNTQRWLGSVNDASQSDAADPQMHPLSRSQSFADDHMSGADESDSLFISAPDPVGSLRPKRDAAQSRLRSHPGHDRDGSGDSSVPGMSGKALRSAFAPSMHSRNQSVATDISHERGNSIDAPPTISSSEGVGDGEGRHKDGGSLEREGDRKRPNGEQRTLYGYDGGDGGDLHFPAVIPPLGAALEEGAGSELLASELERLLKGFAGGLSVVREVLVASREQEVLDEGVMTVRRNGSL